jgi:hypothetical protein
MKSPGSNYQPPVHGGLNDPRSSGAKPLGPRKGPLNDRRSTR